MTFQDECEIQEHLESIVKFGTGALATYVGGNEMLIKFRLPTVYV